MIRAMIGVTTQYLKLRLIKLSMLLNRLSGGDPSQTFSAGSYAKQRKGEPSWTKQIDYLFGKGHCLDCWIYWCIETKMKEFNNA